MIRKYIALLLVVLMLAIPAGCENKTPQEEYPGLEELVELTQKLATDYNAIAEKAINNGWEYNDETVAEMDKFAKCIENINAGIVAPESFADGAIQENIELVKSLAGELKTVGEKVEKEYEIDGMTITDGSGE